MATALVPSFHLKLGHAVIGNHVAVGKFDGRHVSLAAATTGGRVLLHSPQDGDESATHAGPAVRPPAAGGVGVASSSSQLRFLNINRDVTALAAGCMLPSTRRDVLLVGTATSMQAYDVNDNKDLFFRDAPDAVSAAVIGSWSAAGAPIAVAGGNCNILGLDSQGRDAYWTVTGDVVTAVCFGDLDADGRTEMLVGSADFDVRCYRGEEVLGETTETDRITALAIPVPGRFAYALANGTVGVYNGATFTRMWRVKTKARAVALACFDIDHDGEPEVICAYSTGRFEARRVATGDLVYRDSVGAAIAGLVVADYRGDGKPVLMVVTAEGDVRGYGQSTPEVLAAIRAAQAPLEAAAAAAAVPAAPPAPAAAAAPASAATGGAPPSPTAAGAASAGTGAASTGKSMLSAVRGIAGSVATAITAAGATIVQHATGGGGAAAPASANGGPSDLDALLLEYARLDTELRHLEAATAAAASSTSAAGGGAGGARATGKSATVSAGGGSGGGGGAVASGVGVGGPGGAPSPALPATLDVLLGLDFNAPARRLELVVTAVPSLGALAVAGGSSSSPAAAGAGTGGTAAGGGGTGSGTGSVDPDTPFLRAAVAFALDAGIFGPDRESCVVVSPASASASTGALGTAAVAAVVAGATGGGGGSGDPRNVLRIPLAPTGNVATDLRISAVIGTHHSASHYAVIERSFSLPKFAMFQLIASTAPFSLSPLPVPVTPPRGVITFTTKERAKRFATWIVRSFPVRPDHVDVSIVGVPTLEARFVHLRTGGSLGMTVAQEHGGQVQIMCDNMELAGELLQDCAGYLALSEVETIADFPDDFGAFRRTLARLEECTALRSRLAGDSALASTSVKALVIQAEDARLLADMRGMKRFYGELRGVHGELLTEYAKRANNHATLVATLKEVNQMIQRAANLRVGDAKTRVIAQCRNAIRNNTTANMLPIIATGKLG